MLSVLSAIFCCTCACAFSIISYFLLYLCLCFLYYQLFFVVLVLVLSLLSVIFCCTYACAFSINSYWIEVSSHGSTCASKLFLIFFPFFYWVTRLKCGNCQSGMNLALDCRLKTCFWLAIFKTRIRWMRTQIRQVRRIQRIWRIQQIQRIQRVRWIRWIA